MRYLAIASLLVTLAACKGNDAASTSCEGLRTVLDRNLNAQLTAMPANQAEGLRAMAAAPTTAAVAACTEDHWSAAIIACFTTAGPTDDTDAKCGPMLTPAQRANLAKKMFSAAGLK